MSAVLSNVINNETNLTLWEDGAKLNEIRKLFAPKLTDMEFSFFVGMGKATGLNPFLREMWCVKYQDSVPAQVFIGRDGYRKAAQSHADYDYHQCDAVYENDKFEIVNGEVKHSYTLNKRGALIGAYCVTKRHSASKPIYVFAELKEYTTGKSLWNAVSGKPATMIKKVAESQCLRACFQDLLGGTYGEEEMARSPQKLQVVSEGTQTDKLKQILNINTETGEIIEEQENLISSQQEEEIQMFIKEKNFTPAQIDKALSRYHVDSFAQLTDSQAEQILLRLRQ